jgi:hypothetical protein
METNAWLHDRQTVSTTRARTNGEKLVAAHRPALYMHVHMGMQACGVYECSWARVRMWAQQHLAQLLEDLVHFSPRILESRIFLQGWQGLILAFMCV